MPSACRRVVRSPARVRRVRYAPIALAAMVLAAGLAQAQQRLSPLARAVRGYAQPQLEYVGTAFEIGPRQVRVPGDNEITQEHVADTVSSLRFLFDSTIAHASDREYDAIREAHSAYLRASQLASLSPALLERVGPAMVRNDELGLAVAYALRPAGGPLQGNPLQGNDAIEPAYAVIADLIDQYGEERVAEFASLSAALAVVYDRPVYTLRVNEVTTKSPGPAALFGYYSSRAGDLTFDPRAVPAEALVFVVDATAPVNELSWALDRYQRDHDIGDRFFEIQYDHEHVRTGRAKAAVESGYSLPTILRHGGVCADQAYYAMTVAKAKGLPSAYVSARGNDMGHAWVGFIEPQGRTPRWNFDEGRYPEYQLLRGTMTDPQTGKTISDASVGVLAGFMGADAQTRRTAQALADAAWRLMDAERSGEEWITHEMPKGSPPRPRGMEPRSPSSDDHYALMEAGLKLSPNYADGWRILGALTQADPPPPDQLNYWIELLDRLCGREYPDFFVEAIDPIIASVEDPKARVDAWEWVFRRVERTRPDLAALARVRQGEVFEAEGKAHNAWIAYDEVLNRFANQGPFIAEALAKQEAMLTAAGKTRDIAPMYERVWARIDRPQASASQFLRGSTWYRVGSMYARALARVGDDPAAARVRGVLGDS